MYEICHVTINHSDHEEWNEEGESIWIAYYLDSIQQAYYSYKQENFQDIWDSGVQGTFLEQMQIILNSQYLCLNSHISKFKL